MSNDLIIAISKETKSVHSTTPMDFIFNSNNPALSVKKMGSVSLTTTVDEYGEPIGAQEIITHNFGYVPQFMAFTTSYASQMLSKYVFDIMDYVNLDFEVMYTDVAGNVREMVTAYTTDTELVIEAMAYSYSPYYTGNQGIEFTYDVDYILFMEEAKRMS
jgi:hypothetical protein